MAEKMTMVSFRIGDEDRQRIERIARLCGTDASKVYRRLLAEALGTRSSLCRLSHVAPIGNGHCGFCGNALSK